MCAISKHFDLNCPHFYISFGASTLGGFGGISTTTSQPSTNFQHADLNFGKSKAPSTLDTLFRDLDPRHQHEINSIYSKYKYPMREGLHHLRNKFNDETLDKIHASLKATSIGTDQIKSKQETLLKQLKSMREIDTVRSQMAERFGNLGLAQITRMQEGHVSYSHSNETLPIELYREVRMQLLNQVENYNEETRRLLDQIEAVSSQRGIDGSEGTGMYGERVRVGPQHLLQLMQRQSEAFVDVASKVAEIHERADTARALYRRMFPHEDDPFLEQDKLESRERLDKERRVKENIQQESLKHSNSSSSGSGSGNSSGSSSASNSGGGLPNTDPSKPFSLTSATTTTTAAAAPGTANAFGQPGTTSFSLGGSTTNTCGVSNAGFTGFGTSTQSGSTGESSGKKGKTKNKSDSNLGGTFSFASGGASTTGAAPATFGGFGSTTPGTTASFGAPSVSGGFSFTPKK